MLPTYLNNGYGFSGQNAGFLGPKYDPWHVKQDPNAADFRVENLIAAGRPDGRGLDNRVRLARPSRPATARSGRAQTSGEFRRIQDQAFSMLTVEREIGRAFDVRSRADSPPRPYGRHLFGQSLLLARRLVQAGVPIVQANMGTMNNWDTHDSNFKQLKDRLLPPLDQGVSALLDDLEARGLLDETLVVMVGEFGRTPKMGGNVGTPSYVPRRPRPLGRRLLRAVRRRRRARRPGDRPFDKIAAYPASKPYYPSDLGATIYRAGDRSADDDSRSLESAHAFERG